MRSDTTYDKTFTNFVDDLGGFLWHVRTISGMSWKQLAAETRLAEQTLRRLAGRKTANPTSYTIWRVLTQLDHRQIIRHSMLEPYRKLSKPTLRVVRKKEAA